MNFDDFKLYLPQHLSADSKAELFDNLKKYPESIDTKSFYSEFSKYKNELYQGDIIKDLKICDIQREEFKRRTVCIISNSCDVSSEHERFYPAKVVYAPIISLSRYNKYFFKKFSGSRRKEPGCN
ncbi:MAG: hypothetical protein U5L00_01720 [Desulfovermiculus sp.]|nr:hypothetical protein [Desulfovermiculus sp.]